MAIGSRLTPALRRRGFLFTTVALLFVLALLILAGSEDRLLPRTLSQTERVHIMNGYLENLVEDLPRAAYIAAFRSLIGIEEHISTTGDYLGDFDPAFTSMFINGTVNGSAYGIMQNSTFTDFANRFHTLALEQGIRSNLTVLAVNASQTTPWEVALTVSVQIELADFAGTANFSTVRNVSAVIPIEDIKDPVYSIGTQGRAPHVIRRSNVSQPYIGPGNDTMPLQMLVNQTLYIASSQAPSFLQRFTGNFSPSPYGIESLVDIRELRAQGVPITKCRSVVDYLYFDVASTTNYWIINMDTDDFWLDDNHLADYDATGSVLGPASCP